MRILHDKVRERVGPVRFEWVHDGRKPWIVQLHQGLTASSASVIYPGAVTQYIPFNVTEGIDKLREIIRGLGDNSQDGIELIGHIGLTSHMGDLLRKAAIPSIMRDRSVPIQARMDFDYHSETRVSPMDAN